MQAWREEEELGIQSEAGLFNLIQIQSEGTG
jgi:hypothetical protein